MFFEALHRYSSRADRVMMYPAEMLDPGRVDYLNDSRLLFKARDDYSVKLVPITIQHKDNDEGEYSGA